MHLKATFQPTHKGSNVITWQGASFRYLDVTKKRSIWLEIFMFVFVAMYSCLMCLFLSRIGRDDLTPVRQLTSQSSCQLASSSHVITMWPHHNPCSQIISRAAGSHSWEAFTSQAFSSQRCLEVKCILVTLLTEIKKIHKLVMKVYLTGWKNISITWRIINLICFAVIFSYLF